MKRKHSDKVRIINILYWICPVVLLTFGGLVVPNQAAWASWFIDPVRRHISIHADMSCLDCHDDLPDRDIHPNPNNVTKSRRDLFDRENCLECHDDIIDDLTDGLHGRREVKDPERYQWCTGCHNPHYLRLRSPGDRDKFDPGFPRTRQCGVCHEIEKALPPPDEDEKACLACHNRPQLRGPERMEQISNLCLSCHNPENTRPGNSSPLIDPAFIRNTPHGKYDCLACHPRAANFRHDRQKAVNCRQCHQPHGEKEAHDAHLNVDCQACHLVDISLATDPRTGRITARPNRRAGAASNIHSIIEEPDETTCRRCHVPGNPFGVATMVLPAKSIICMPCHTATFSAGDAITIISLLIFVLGLVLAASVWFSGRLSEDSTAAAGPGKALRAAGQAVFSDKFAAILKALILDGLLQRRLYLQSPGRWFIHALIFWPFVLRFIWGWFTWFGFSWAPGSHLFQAMIDKNHPATALIFDLSGALVLAGVILALIRRRLAQKAGRPVNLPGQDHLALGLLGGIVLGGFFLEAMRMAMTMPGDSGAYYAFIGHVLSKLFTGAPWLNEVYGYIWYMHALLTGGFIAYIPFSRMFHIIMGPLAAAVHGAAEPHLKTKGH